MPNPELLIASDIFFKDWGDAAAGEIWLSLRPHIALPADADGAVTDYALFTNWLSHPQGAGCIYRMMADGSIANVQFPQAVTFPEDVNIRVKIDYADGVVRPVPEVMRSSRLKIDKPDVFAAENTQKIPGIVKPLAGAGALVDPLAKPFIKAFYEQLGLAAVEAQTHGGIGIVADEVARTLTHGRHFLASPNSIPDIATDAGVLRAPSAQPGLIVTSIHSMLGHLVKIGKRSDLALLQTITNIRVELFSGVTTFASFDFQALIPAGKPSVTDFFSAIKSKFAGKVDLRWAPALDKRVIVSDELTTFACRGEATQHWYMRREERGDGGAQSMPLSLMRRLRVDLRQPEGPAFMTATSFYTLSGAAIAAAPPATLEFTPYMAVGAQLRVYRGFPAALGNNGNCLLKLIPRSEEREHFWREIEALTRGKLWNAYQQDVAAFFASVDFEADDGSLLNPKPEFIFCGPLPWDHADDGSAPMTLLFLGKGGAGSTALGTGANGLAVTLAIKRDVTLSAKSYSPGPDQSVYWDVRYPPSGPFQNDNRDFNRLRLSKPDPATFDVQSLVPNIGFGGDASFAFCQSMSQTEAVARVAYPYDSAAAITPEAEFQDDLISFVNLRLARMTGGVAEEVISGSNRFPIFANTPAAADKTRFQTFQFKVTAPETPIAASGPDQGKVDLARVPDHNFAWYTNASSMPAAMVLRPRLAHLLGAEMTGQGDVSGAEAKLPDLEAPRYLDTAVAMPTRVATKETAADQTVTKERFILLNFLGPGDPGANGADVVRLTFNTSLLRTPLVTDDARIALFMDAWTSVAELCSADKIELDGFPARFAYGTALAGGGSPIRLADGLVIGSLSWDAKVAIQGALAALRGQFPNTIPPQIQIDIVITRAGNPPFLYQIANAVEFRLRVERTPAKAPPDSPAVWSLARRVTTQPDGTPLDPRDLYTIDGTRTAPVTAGDPDSATIKSRFAEWLDSLNARSDTIDIGDGLIAVAKTFRGLIGGRSHSGGLVLTNWIVPHGDVDPVPGDAAVFIVPVGFRPILPHPEFGQKTDVVYQHYLDWLQAAIDCANTDMAKTYTAADWKSYFAKIWELVDDTGGTSKYQRLIGQLAHLLWPLNDPARTDENGKPLYRLEMRDTLTALQSTVPGSLGSVFRSAAEAQLSKFPRLFFAAKALLYTGLEEQNRPSLPSSFYRLRTAREYLPAQLSFGNSGGIPTPKVTQPGIDAATLTLPEALASQGSSKLFGFQETLLDTLYNDRARVSSFALDTFEAVVDGADPLKAAQMRVALQRAPSHGIKITSIEVPDGALKQPDPVTGVIADNDRHIHLASRKRVANPQLIAALPIPAMQDLKWLDEAYNHPPPAGYSIAGLKRGKLQPAKAGQNGEPDEIGFEFVSTIPGSTQNTQRQDDPVVSFLFLIEGDEEAFQTEDGWIGSLNNDAFELEASKIAFAPQPTLALPQIQGDERKLYDLLPEVADAKELAAQEFLAGLSADAMTNLARSVITQPAKKPQLRSLIVGFRDDPKTRRVNVQIAPHDWEYKDGMRQGHLLRAQKKPGAPVTGVFLLLINVELPVWQRYEVKALHTRNMIDSGSDWTPGQIFARDFGFVSEQVTPPAPLTITAEVMRNHESAVRRADGSGLTVRQLIQIFLIDTGILDSTAPWREFDLSITVSQEMRTRVRAAYFDASGVAVYPPDVDLREGYPVFPLANHRIAANDGVDTQIDWFNPDMLHYQLDFHWSSPSNLRIFSVRGVRVAIGTSAVQPLGFEG